MSVAFYLRISRVFSLCTELVQQQTHACSTPSTGHGNLPGRFCFNRKEPFMFAQVAQVYFSEKRIPFRVTRGGWLSQIFFYMIRVPLQIFRTLQWNTITGNPTNEYRRRRRHRCRLSKNTWTLHSPPRWKRNRLHPLVP